MNSREKSIAKRAFDHVLNQRLSGQRRYEVSPSVNVDMPEVRVTNEVEAPQVFVTVDMTPVAKALDRMTEQLAIQNEYTQQLLVEMSDQPQALVTVTNQPAVTNVSAPQVHVSPKLTTNADPINELTALIRELLDRRPPTFKMVVDKDGSKSVVPVT